MGKPKVEDTVREITESVIGELGLELVDVEYVKEGSAWFLRLFIDKPEGITHDDCQAVSEKVGQLLDEKDPIPMAYVFEVSSPGIDRPLKKTGDFERFKGNKVRATTFAPIGGRKEFIGELLGLADDQVLIEIDGKQVALPMQQTAKVRLEADFK